MSIERIEIVPDPSVPAGGYAIVRLYGLGQLPEPANFQIIPMDGQSQSGWPNGHLKPRHIRLAARGVEMRIGPEIVNAPGLQPGTPVSFVLPALGVRGNLRWPDLRLRDPNGQETTGINPQRNGFAGPEQGLSSLQANRNNSNAEAMQAAALAAAESPGVPGPAPVSQQAPAGGSTKTIDSAGPSREAPAVSAPINLQPQPGPAKLVPAKPTIATDRAPVEPRGSFTAWPIVVGLVAVGAMIALIWPGLREEFAKLPATGEPVSVAGGTSPPANVASAVPTLPAEPDIRTLITAGEKSPRGEDATGIDNGEALERANRFMHGVEGPVDREEASFWLRHALSRNIADPSMRWAITQLGTIYAAPDAGKQPDYAAARFLWRLASAAGDPVATCFLGRLHEFGLGVAVNKNAARAKYQEAQRLGGCRGLKASLSRLGE